MTIQHSTPIQLNKSDKTNGNISLLFIIFQLFCFEKILTLVDRYKNDSGHKNFVSSVFKKVDVTKEATKYKLWT